MRLGPARPDLPGGGELPREAVPFFLCRIDDDRELVDEDAATWRESPTCSRFPLAMVFRGDQPEDFLLAKDRTYPNMVLASQRFVDLCAAAECAIGFTPVPLSS